MTNRVVIVSNRLPFSVRTVNGNYLIVPSIGGLATGVAPFHAKHPSLWIGWSGIEANVSSKEQARLREIFLKDHRCLPLFYTPRDLKYYYYGTCNDTLWPLLHGFGETARQDELSWQVYEEVNARVAAAVIEQYQPNDIIWIHDYQMLLVAKYIRQKLPNATIGFFLHIPFPPFDILRILPQRDVLIDAMLKNDLIGFHTYDYVQNFLDSVRRLTGFSHHLGHIRTVDRLVRVDAFPLGIDYPRFAHAAKKASVRREVKKLHHDIGRRTMLLSLDRLDYTKGIRQRLEAFADLLERYPQYRNKITLVLVLAIVRPKVVLFQKLKQQIDRLIGQINGTYGGIHWTPIRYIVQTLNFDQLTALYAAADVTLITPLKDGMNLVAKEYVATRQDGRGVLVLSEMAGAAEELGEAVQINPYNKTAFAESIHQALRMPMAERRWRMRNMQDRLARYPTQRWVDDFMWTLQDTKAEQLNWHTKLITPKLQHDIVRQFQCAQQRLIFLDYDGTLTEFVRLPRKANPDAALLRILRNLSNYPKTTVVIISGRDHHTLSRWFTGLRCGLVAEHGAWIKDIGKPWKMIDLPEADWKKNVRSLLEYYVDRTPGSSIEEKQTSLVWHYRSVKSQIAEVRANQLHEALINLSDDHNLRVIGGNAVIEIIPNHIHKGMVLSQWLRRQRQGFVLAAGDDRTDEDMFQALPKRSVSIKVRLEPSQARYAVANTQAMRQLLKMLASSK